MTNYHFKNPKLYDADGRLDDRWYVFYYYRSPESAKFERFKIYVSQAILTKSGRRDEAHRIMKDLTAKLAAGWNPYEVSEKRFASLMKCLDEVIAIKIASTRKRTAYTYRNHAKTFADWLISESKRTIKVSEFTQAEAVRYMDYLKVNAGYSNRTFNNHLISMKALFALIAKRNFLQANPFSEIESLPVEETSIVAFSEKDLKCIVETLPGYNPRLWLIVQLVYYCFLRPQEIVRIRYKDIDLERRQIRLSGWQTKNTRSQVVDIPDPLYNELLKEKDYHRDMFVFSRKLLPGYAEIAQTRIDEAWDDYRKTYNFPGDWKIYSMKHTGAGRLADANVDLRSIQLQMRHHSLEETQKYFDRFRRRPNEKLRRDFPGLG